MAWKRYSSLAQLFAQKSLSSCRRIHAVDVFPLYWWINCPTIWDKGAAEPFSMSPGLALSDPQPSHHHKADRILLGALTEIPVQASTCARCWMYLQTALGLSRQGTQKTEKGKIILLVFADTKVLWFASMARESWEINPHSPKLDKHRSGSCCRCCSLSLFH